MHLFEGIPLVTERIVDINWIDVVQVVTNIASLVASIGSIIALIYVGLQFMRDKKIELLILNGRNDPVLLI